MTVIRLSLAVFALAVGAWFALGARAAHDIDRASSIVSDDGRLTAGQAAQARSLLDSAAVLNPDTTIDLLRAQVAQLRNEDARALAITLELNRKEPLNAEGWVELARLTQHGHRQLLALALRNIARLDPPVK